MRKIWIGTSWKMNKTRAQALDFVAGLTPHPAGDARVQRFVIPPFTVLRDVATGLDGTDILVGAQNMHWADHGAWTGEISAPMIADCGARIVELGHSERRHNFGETDATVALKVANALRHGLTPLICIGETLAEREAGRARAVLQSQTEAALSAIDPAHRGQEILFAYEPVWAIGDGGIPATSDYAQDRQAEIKAVARAVMGRDLPCLYGGSVNPQNCAELIACPDVDGLFIGRSAWDVAGYLDIVARVGRALDQM